MRRLRFWLVVIVVLFVLGVTYSPPTFTREQIERQSIAHYERAQRLYRVELRERASHHQLARPVVVHTEVTQ